MNILSLAPTSFFGDYGCHVRILEEARALQALGHRVSILTYFKGDDVPDARVIRTAPTPYHASYEVGSSRHKYAFDALLALKLAQTLAREKFDLIHAHLHEGALIGGALGKVWGKPVFFDYQGSLTDEMLHHGFLRNNGKRHRFWRWVERRAENLPDAIFASTQNAALTLAQKLPAKPIAHLPDGVNTRVFTPDAQDPVKRAELRDQFGIAPGAPVVVFLGLLARHQGIQHILEAAAIAKPINPQVRWLVLGYPGVDEWQARALAVGVDDVVVFGGRVPYPRAPEMLALGDIAIAPKLSLTEGSGKVLNYMAMALPTVAFDTPGQREYLGKYGTYAPLGDSAALAQRILALVASPAQRRELGQHLRSRAIQQFSWERSAQIMQEMYEKVLRRDG